MTGQITGNITGEVTGNASSASLVDVSETASSNLTYFPTFVSASSGNTEIRTDSQNLQYNPFENRLTVTNFKSTTDFEIQGNLNVTGALTFFQSQVGSIANHDTDALTEGTTNLYYLDERVDDRVNALITAGTGITKVYDDAANTYTLTVTQSDIDTDNVTEGSTNLFTTAARTRTHFTYGTGITHSSGTLSVTQADINTDNITEGSTNVFFTNARADARVVAGITGKLDASAISTFGLTLVDDADAAAVIATLGLGTAATTASTAYATAAQGTLAASATQPGDLSTVATSGAYNDLSGKPTLFSGDYDDLSNKPTLGLSLIHI